MAAADGLPMEAIVMADIAIVLLAGAVMVKLSRRLHQPPVVAEIATGIMLGPSVLGLLPGDLPARIFPHDALPMLSAIAQVGLALFMFLAGWELDLSRLRGRGRAVGTMAGLAMAVPFVLGLGAAALLFGGHGADGVSGLSFTLYLATAFSITAFPVLARIIRDSRLSHTRVGTMAMACAAIGDVVAWCVLVLVVAIADASGAGQFLSVVAWTVAYGVGMAVIVRPLLHRVVRRVARRGDTASLLILIVSGVFLSSYATSWIGIHAIFGAFAFGLIMPHGQAPELHEHVGFPLEKAAGLLLPVFFVITGLSVDIGALGAGGLLSLALVIAAAVIGKFAGAAIPARLSGMSWREAGAFGALMNTRGLTEIVILDIGRELGLIDAEMFTMMVVMALLTTTMAGPLLRVLRVGPSAPAAGGGPAAVPRDSPDAHLDTVPSGTGLRPLPEGSA
ncbi:cation:proton antiporter domain-containing protein [Streptomyces sp. NBC_01803]|uniref:cation:proton antiporter domain-containing protein n=1 Tax=Streptomyces sp. NBC_01803 TaxID=2975946 RepID=UPI002DDA24E9|nr:cation:proton antiporter [Streptomyces sp. NBC_01803]WSA47011.1 cation:proton antiporter [Streptomyces sp. NBC_01803]